MEAHFGHKNINCNRQLKYHACFRVVSLVIQPRMPLVPLRGALLWKGLEVFMNVYIGSCMIPASRLMFSNTKKLEQAQKRQVDQCQSQSSSIAEVSCQDEAPAAKRLRSSLGLIHDKNKCVWCCKPESAKH